MWYTIGFRRGELRMVQVYPGEKPEQAVRAANCEPPPGEQYPSFATPEEGWEYIAQHYPQYQP